MPNLYVDGFVVGVFLFIFSKYPRNCGILLYPCLALLTRVAFPPHAFQFLVEIPDFNPQEPNVPQKTQNAVVYDYSEEMKLSEVQVPSVKKGQCLVEVKAAAINPIDWKLGMPPLLTYMKPVVGFDFSGVVVQSNECKYSPGTEVYGLMEQGSLQKYARAKEIQIVEKPSRFTHEQAAALVMTFKTSYQGIIEHAALKPRQKLLILGGSGGCGSIGIQIAKRFVPASTVYSTSSTKNIPFLKELGADVTIDYKTQSVTDVIAPKSLDVIYDTVGKRVELSTMLSLLKDGGVFVTIAQKPIPEKLTNSRVKIDIFTMHFDATNLQMLEMFDEIPTVPMELFNLNEYEQAFTQLKSKRTRGKLVFNDGFV